MTSFKTPGWGHFLYCVCLFGVVREEIGFVLSFLLFALYTDSMKGAGLMTHTQPRSPHIVLGFLMK